MINKVSTYIIYSIIIIYSSIIFLPKINIYFFMEKLLSKHEIIISDENIKENYLSFNINNLNIYTNEKKWASVNNIKSSIYFFNNFIEINDLNIEKNHKSTYIKSIQLKQNILTPLTINLNINAPQGNILGEIDLYSNKIIFKLNDKSNQIINLLSRDKIIYRNGVTIYEY